MDRESNKRLARHIVDALKSLKDPKGSTLKDIKKFLVSQGQLNPDMDIKPGILAALKSKKVSRPEGAKGHFLFWDNKHRSCGDDHASSSKQKRCSRPSCGKKRQRCCPRPCCRKRRRRSCRRTPRRCCRRKYHRLTRRAALKKISTMKIPSGKQLVVFYAKKRKRKCK